jgi:hypothetical protein
MTILMTASLLYKHNSCDAVLFQDHFVGSAKWFRCCGHFVAAAASHQTLEQQVCWTWPRLA